MGQYMKHCAVEREKPARVGVGEGVVSVQVQAVALANRAASPCRVVSLPYMPL